MSKHTIWLGDIASDPKISASGCRLAIALAALAGGRWRVRCRVATLALAANQATRHQGDTLKSLADRGYIRLHGAQGGRLDIEILAQREEAAPSTGKPFREISGPVVGVTPGGKNFFSIYVDSSVAMMKLSMTSDDVERIAAAAGIGRGVEITRGAK